MADDQRRRIRSLQSLQPLCRFAVALEASQVLAADKAHHRAAGLSDGGASPVHRTFAPLRSGCPSLREAAPKAARQSSPAGCGSAASLPLPSKSTIGVGSPCRQRAIARSASSAATSRRMRAHNRLAQRNRRLDLSQSFGKQLCRPEQRARHLGRIVTQRFDFAIRLCGFRKLF